MKRRVAFIVYPGVTLLDVTGPLQVFSSANREMADGTTRYETVVVSTEGGIIGTDTGVEIRTDSIQSLARKRIDTVVVAGGSGVFEASQDAAMIAWLRSRVPLVRRAVSTCMGAFLMAEAGLLEGKTVTTHWRWCAELSSRYPDLVVIPEPIYIKDGKFASSAGVTAGIDLSLSLVEEDHGHILALAVAKSLVLYLRRTGSQSQFSSMKVQKSAEYSGRFNDLNLWINEHLDHDLTVEKLADRIGMSPRNFSRIYSRLVGNSPAKAVEIMRLERAKFMLETTKIGVKSISRQCGFGDYERMRRTFVRQTAISPMEYRRRFCSDCC